MELLPGDAYVPDILSGEIQEKALLGSALAAWVFVLLSGLGSDVNPTPGRLVFSVCISSGLFLNCVLAAARDFRKSKCGFVIGQARLIRMERGQVLWEVPWSELRVSVQERPLYRISHRSITYSLQTQEGRELGEIGFNLRQDTREGRIQRLAMANFLACLDNVDVVRPALPARKKGYLLRGVVWTLCGSLVALAGYRGMSAFVSNVAPTGLERLMALAFPLSLFGGGLVTLLGLVEVTHVFRDRDQPSDLAKSLRKFAERGVLTRVEMVEGQWYGYRNPDQLNTVYTGQIKFAWIFICSALLTLATAHLVQRYLGVPRNWMPWEYATAVGIFTALAALMTAYLLWFAAKAHHRFQVKDGVLHVDTGKAILVFPALPSKACNQISGRSMWLSAYDVYGHWPRSYALDPRYLEPQST